MPITLQGPDPDGILLVRVEEFPSRVETAAAIARAAEIGAEKIVSAVIIDARRVEIHPSSAVWSESIENMFLAANAAAPIVYVSPPDWPTERTQIAKKHAASAGFRFALFSEMDDALNWLLVQMPARALAH
jgi:hypothetical protein